MSNNITKDDKDALIDFLKTDQFLTNGKKVLEFEEAWSKWLGVKYSVFVNSGASANLITMAYLKTISKPGDEIIVPTLTWVSDISSVIQNGFEPKFVDIDPTTLGMNWGHVASSWGTKTKAVFLTHVMGFNGIGKGTHLPRRELLIEDCCESHGATWHGKKLGTFGHISNFSFYYAHHMSTIEGGMVCTDDEEIYETIRTFRSHGMAREIRNPKIRERYYKAHYELRPEFIFLNPAYNVRSTEINAVLGLSQLKRLDENNAKRIKNFDIFLNELSPKLYRTELFTEGAVNYAFTPILREPDLKLRDKVEKLFSLCQVEFRRALSGGGNQLRQPYLKHLKWNRKDYPEVEHVSDFSWYIGNYPDLEPKKIHQLCKLLNQF